MSATGHSVFAPFSRVPPAVGRVVPDQPVPGIRTAAPCRDHAHSFVLTNTAPALVRRVQDVTPEDPTGRRTRIWEFNQNLHCSIIGTCLSTGELRQTLSRLGLARPESTDHELHHIGVVQAGKHDQAARSLHKALDRRHKLAISQFGKAKTEAEVTALWRAAVRNGEIPGAYWAVLTHPATTPALVRLVFGEVHMLSHLVGAANRADIRRLAELELRNAGLEEKLRRQQAALHQAVVSRDAVIRDLREALRRELAEAVPAGNGDETEALRALVRDLEKTLNAESRRRAAVETRLADTSDSLVRERAGHAALAGECRALRAELAALEAGLTPDAAVADWRLDGLTVLYVGGRPHQIAHLRGLSEARGASLLHHDGGVEHNPDLLAGLTSRADAVLFPVDCVSHEAVLLVRRQCRQVDKPFIPLRSAGATSFLAALRSIPALLESGRMIA